MMTTPGGGSCDGLGRKPGWDAPEKAANSATSGDVLTTPTPPATYPFLKRGTPPGLKAVGSPSMVSALPVIMPGPKLRTSIERAGLMFCPGKKMEFNVQPRLVFSIP